MKSINWQKKVENVKDDLLSDTQSLLEIKSVLDIDTVKVGAPFGEGINQALLYLLNKAEKDGFRTKNLDGYAGYIEFGEGEELVGILCHIDVVPEGSDWTYDPYGATIHDGKIYARGAIDDKGPTMAAYYAMKIVKELGESLSKRVRMIIGCDEESNWRCVEYYFQREEMPTVGFSPDAEFPIINAEKGIYDLLLELRGDNNDDVSDYELLSFQAGYRLNMVPDMAEAILKGNMKEIEHRFQAFITEHQLQGEAQMKGEQIILQLKGVSAHGMEPNHGKNAGLLLAQFLNQIDLNDHAKHYIAFINQYFEADTRGKKLGIDAFDEKMGELTVNCGIFSYNKTDGGTIGLNIRYPRSVDSNWIKSRINQVLADHCFTLKELADSKPHYVDEQQPLIKTLQKVYERQTGDKANLVAIGGGTYARALDVGVAFGPLFPNREDVAHQKDEYIYINDLLKATAIYAEAIYELAKKEESEKSF